MKIFSKEEKRIIEESSDLIERIVSSPSYSDLKSLSKFLNNFDLFRKIMFSLSLVDESFSNHLKIKVHSKLRNGYANPVDFEFSLIKPDFPLIVLSLRGGPIRTDRSDLVEYVTRAVLFELSSLPIDPLVILMEKLVKKLKIEIIMENDI